MLIYCKHLNRVGPVRSLDKEEEDASHLFYYKVWTDDHKLLHESNLT